MATIPIEVIVQDKASPEPTPSDSEVTNIVVPDTGAGIEENGSNGEGIGSVTNIILPAIILLLAVGAIVALLIRRQQRRKNNTNTDISKKEKLATATSGTIAILVATVLVGNLVIPATKAATSVGPGTAELDTVDKITITATREIDSDTVVATVQNTSYATANLDFGYKVTASMIEGATTANLYLDGDETSEYYIAPVENEGEGNEDVIGNTELANNTWGYTLEEPSEGTTYLPIPLEDTPATIAKGNDVVEDEAVDIYYAIKVDKDMPAGTYAGEIEYNISPTVEYMQDFATMTKAEKTATLANILEGKQYILKDIRDEQPYYISKLADDNVWMTQNLDLNLSTEVTLTPADTDVTENWTPTRSTISFTGTTVDGWEMDLNTPYSADPGDVYYYTSDTDADDMKYDSLEECEAEHSDGACRHYHAGNYYNWSAAVASNDTSEHTEEFDFVGTSICPAGWQLPIGPNADERGRNGIANVLENYSMVGSVQEYHGNRYYPYINGGFDAMRTDPTWLIRSGEIVDIALYKSAHSGMYWTNTTRTIYSFSAYMLEFGSYGNGVFSDQGNRGAGLSVRCTVK